mmetsp:Transcript_115437/g.358639  ORF Transcript_115437/g.358639 Transcript_115437/m.358639 type:complete len:629 (-) Transcript_115437:115-2001(-)
MDFGPSEKHKREVEQRRKEAKRKLEQQRRDEEMRAAMEQEHRERELVRLKQAEEERQRAEKEALLNDGVHYAARLRPYPSARTDDKLELPPSALQELERQGALDRGSLLTFAVSLPGAAAVPGAGPATPGAGTHAGVAEFTAEEGSVGVPPRVALCLTKGSGLESLAAVGQVEVRYVRLPRSAKSLARLQPRGEGFHIGGASVLRMDLQHVLQETLRGHTALTEGDWLPIRHNGITYELVVRNLEPEPHIALLDTDLTVEVMPSERTEAEMRAEEERKAREEAAKREAEEQERLRLQRAQQKALELGPEPEAGPEVVQLMLRLPEGGRLMRRFVRAASLRQVLDWIESEPSTHVRPEAFRVVQKWPGHCRELGPAEAEQQLSSLGFARQEALFLQHLQEEAAAPPTGDAAEDAPEQQEAKGGVQRAVPALAAPGAGSAWSEAEERAHEALDRRLAGDRGTPTATARNEPELAEVRGQELVGVFERLVALGMRPPEAAIAAKKYAAQLKELGEMGFENWLEAVPLLEKYGGRLLRVANLLSEAAAEAGGSEGAQPEGPRPSGAAPAQAAVAPAPAPAPSEAPTPQAPAAHEEKLRELAGMGFTDEARNRALLQKYAGRLERVVEALVSG